MTVSPTARNSWSCNKDIAYSEIGNRMLDICYIKFLFEIVNSNYLANQVEQE
jgi:hypothetical protein